MSLYHHSSFLAATHSFILLTIDSVEINSELSDDLQTVDLLNVFNSLYQLDTTEDSVFRAVNSGGRCAS